MSALKRNAHLASVEGFLLQILFISFIRNRVCLNLFQTQYDCETQCLLAKLELLSAGNGKLIINGGKIFML